MKYLCFTILLIFTVNCKNNEREKDRKTTVTSKIEVKTKIQSDTIVNPIIEYTNIKYYQWELSSQYDTTYKIKGLEVLPAVFHRSAFAYYLEFDDNYDSCRLTGWNDWLTSKEYLKVKKIDKANFIINLYNNAYYEFKFNSDETISMREIGLNMGNENKYLSYRGIDKTSLSWVTVMSGVEEIARKLLIGKYEVTYTDGINSEDWILFAEDNRLEGFGEYSRYYLNMGEPDYPSDYNSIRFFSKNKDKLELIFETNLDTLIFRNVGETYTDPGSGTTLRKDGTIRLKLIKKE